MLLMHIPIYFPGVRWGPSDVMGHPEWGTGTVWTTNDVDDGSSDGEDGEDVERSPGSCCLFNRFRTSTRIRVKEIERVKHSEFHFFSLHTRRFLVENMMNIVL